MDKEIIVRGRKIGAGEVALIGGLIAREGVRGRTHVSEVLCRLWDWRQANGSYREIACRDLLRQLERKGLIVLPAKRKSARRPGCTNTVGPLPPMDTSAMEAPFSRIRPQVRVELAKGNADTRLHNSLVAHYHYLGYRQPVGASLKYLCHCGERVVAAIGFGPAAWKVACRDAFIGWDRAGREANLHAVVNNDRFVILPWVRVPHLASFLLGHCLRRLRRDWMERYATPIVLAETFVERARFAGTCYRASNWRRLGETRGRGRNDRAHRNAEPVRDVLVYPLHRSFRERLRRIEGMPEARGDAAQES
ncbi:MAG TPA: Druantia anti-phage system protein DruA [Burkholderiales bacterium]|jgi:hypothetical protein|nr:Druantia anti-phage system protein DruA [Terriglobales bacterium]HSC95522.1 Druantia anti-phage system protein DruA [Burkholderiales bacterium]